MRITAGLAPMAGFTDMPFRVICSELGASYSVSEMISAAAVCYNDKKTFELARISPAEAPCALQIFGHDPVQMAEAAERLIQDAAPYAKPCAIDINMGCPVRKIVTSGDGSALMRSPEIAAKVTRAVSDVTRRLGLPLWVKIRAGWDASSINAPYFAALMADSGAERITVHGRTREQMYAPSSDNRVIKAVRAEVDKSVEIIGNGDINCYADALRMLEETCCDGVAVGRAACGNPWIFGEILAAAEGKPVHEITINDRIECALRLTRDVIAIKGEVTGVRESRGRAAHFIRGLKGSAAIRDAMNHATTYEEFEKVLLRLKTEESL